MSDNLTPTPIVNIPGAEISNPWANPEQFNHTVRAASALAKSSLVPTAYQGKPEDCFIVLDMAQRVGMTPLMAMQALNVVKGKPSWNGQACMAIIRADSEFVNPRPVYVGKTGTDERGCYIKARLASTGEEICGTTVTIAMAKAEGWTSNSKWRNMPEQMLAYRAAAFFARVYCPERLMGCAVEGEAEDSASKGSNLTEALKGENNA